MKKAVLPIVLCVLLLCGCDEVHYYHTESSQQPSAESVYDPVAPFVCGDAGVYDTVNDAEYLLEPNVFARERGEQLFSDGKHTVYRVKDVHESFLLCDAQNRVYRNSGKSWLAEPGSEEWKEMHPALLYRPSSNDETSAD